MLKEICLLRKQLLAKSPLIHCLTNHITINDCANAVLAVGAKPIMAEHPAEVEEITASASALAVNLGNINDSRMQSMLLSGKKALQLGIPCIIDLVGIGCSNLRLEFAKKFILECQPAVIKGNASEIKALLYKTQVKGIDVSENDKELALAELVEYAKAVAQKYDCICLLSGKVDVVASKEKTFLLDNGHPLMALVTGTGCVLNVLCAAYMSSGELLKAVLCACLLLSVCGEVAAQDAPGLGSFKVKLMDYLYNLPDEILLAKARLKEVPDEKI